MKKNWIHSWQYRATLLFIMAGITALTCTKPLNDDQIQSIWALTLVVNTIITMCVWVSWHSTPWRVARREKIKIDKEDTIEQWKTYLWDKEVYGMKAADKKK